MEVWKGTHYLSKNATIWVELMNKSTLEMGVGYFPDHVVALTGEYNDTYTFPNGTLVIENATKNSLGTDGIERAVFITTSVVSIVCAAIWIILNWKKIKSGGQPVPPSPPPVAPNSDVASQGTGGTELNSIGDNGVSAASFERKLRFFFYDSTKTHLEVWEKDTNMDNVAAEDFEAGSALLRKMYGLDLEMWARQGPSQTAEELNEQQWKSEAMFKEVRRLADEWDEVLQNTSAGATQRELREMSEVRQILDSLPGERYEHKRPLEPETPEVVQQNRRVFGMV